jgi:hypothetical protein
MVDGIMVLYEFVVKLTNFNEQQQKGNQTYLSLAKNALSMHNLLALL